MTLAGPSPTRISNALFAARRRTNAPSPTIASPDYTVPPITVARRDPASRGSSLGHAGQGLLRARGGPPHGFRERGEPAGDGPPHAPGDVVPLLELGALLVRRLRPRGQLPRDVVLGVDLLRLGRGGDAGVVHLGGDLMLVVEFFQPRRRRRRRVARAPGHLPEESRARRRVRRGRSGGDGGDEGPWGPHPRRRRRRRPPPPGGHAARVVDGNFPLVRHRGAPLRHLRAGRHSRHLFHLKLLLQDGHARAVLARLAAHLRSLGPRAGRSPRRGVQLVRRGAVQMHRLVVVPGDVRLHGARRQVDGGLARHRGERESDARRTGEEDARRASQTRASARTTVLLPRISVSSIDLDDSRADADGFQIERPNKVSCQYNDPRASRSTSRGAMPPRRARGRAAAIASPSDSDPEWDPAASASEEAADDAPLSRRRASRGARCRGDARRRALVLTETERALRGG